MGVKRDRAQELTDRLVSAMEVADPSSWVAPWVGTAGLPVNRVTGHEYQGGNVILLAWLGEGDREFATYRQWRTLGAQVRKGEKGSPVMYPVSVVTNRKGVKERGEKEKRVTVFRWGNVFGARQVDGYEPEPEVLPDVAERIVSADRMIDRTGAAVTYGGNRAFYRPGDDTVRIPDRERFTSTAGLYSTVFHELAHWTGHSSRLDRWKDGAAGFGTAKYAGEELIAEIASYFVSARFRLGSERTEDAAAYLANWVQLLKADKNAIFKAAAEAQKAAGYLLEGGVKRVAPVPRITRVHKPLKAKPTAAKPTAAKPKAEAKPKPKPRVKARPRVANPVLSRANLEDALAALKAVCPKPGRDIPCPVKLDADGIHWQRASVLPEGWGFQGEGFAPDLDAVKKAAREAGKPSAPVGEIVSVDGRVKLCGITLPESAEDIPVEGCGEFQGGDTLSALDLAELAGFSSTDDMRRILMSVYLTGEGGVATDSYRLAVDTSLAIAGEPYAVRAGLIKAAGKAGTVRIVSDGIYCRAEWTTGKGTRVRVRDRLVDGQFPNYRQLFPDDDAYTLSATVAPDAIDSLGKVGRWTRKNQPVVISFNGSGTVETSRLAEATVDPVPLTGETVKLGDDAEYRMGANPVFLASAIEYAGGELRAISPMRPVELRKGSRSALVMPIKLADEDKEVKVEA